MNERQACEAEGGQKVDQTSEAWKADLSTGNILDRYTETVEQLHGLVGSRMMQLVVIMADDQASNWMFRVEDCRMENRICEVSHSPQTTTHSN